jgi:hypothetical protein
MKRIEIYKKTNDNWYGNYNTNEIKLKYIGKLTDNKFRVACWGNDDFGLERDFDYENDAIKMFELLKYKNFINHKDLYDLNFNNS